jgi:iron transport multicopper oxidase
MAISLSNFLISICLFLTVVLADVVTYDFDVSCLATRPVIGINEKWPIPAIIVTKGDRVIVNVKNSLGNESTSIHFHGLYQVSFLIVISIVYRTDCP